MPQPVSFNTGTPVSGSIQENIISYVVDGQQRDYRGGYNGLAWMSEAPATNNVIFIGNTTNVGRGPANKPLFYPSFNNSEANIIYAANKLPGSPGTFNTTTDAYDWAIGNNFFINNSNNPIPRIDADGLIFYVDANQPGSYPGINNTGYDISGNGNNGNLLNGTNWNLEGWFEFDGADDRISTSFGFQNNNESHEALIYSKGNVSTYNMFMGIILPYYAFYNGNTFLIQDSIGGAQVGYFTGTLSLNRWYHFLSTRSYNGTNTTLTTYINGTLSNQSTYSGAPTQPGGTWAIGNWDAPSAGASYPFYGDISGVKIYTQTLTEAQVKQNYFQSNIVTNNMIYAIDASNLVSYPRSGTTTYPLTGSQTGTLTNGVGYSNSNGGIWSFDGIDDYINLSTDPWTANDFADDSISIWFKFSSAGVILGQNMNAPFGSNGWVPAIYIDTSYQLRTSVFWGGSTGNQTVSPSALLTNTWYNVTVTNEGGTQRTYLNGELIGTLSKTQTSYAGVYYYTLGAARWNGWGGTSGDIGYISGQIANLYYYNKTLSSDEVQQNYQATKDKFQGPQMVTQGLVVHLDAANKDSYPETGNTWYDLSGNGNNATKNGNVANPVWNSSGGYFTFAASDGSTGANNIFTIANSATLSNLANVTVQFICAMETKTLVGSDYDWMCIVTKGEEGGNQRPGTSVNQLPGNRYYHIETPNGVNSVGDLFTNADYTGNKWNLFQTRVSNAGGTQGWLNGTQVATSGVTTTGNTSTTYIGSNGFFELFKGKLGVVCIYNRALSDAELVQNYNYFKARFNI
jgi:hypothetical protein